MAEWTLEQKKAALIAAHSAGDTDGARRIAAAISADKQYQEQAKATGLPTAKEEVSTGVRQFFDPTYPSPRADIGDIGRQQARALALSVPMFMGPVQGGAAAGLFQGLSSMPSEGGVLDKAAHVGKDALVGGALGLPFKVGSWAVRGALPRARTMALKTLEPNASETQALEKDFGSWEDAGKLVRESGAADTGLNLRERRDIIRRVGQKGNAAVEEDLARARNLGAKADMQQVVQGLDRTRKRIFQPGSETGPTHAAGDRAAAEHVLEMQTNPNFDPANPDQILNLETAKKTAGVEGYLKGGKYFDPTAAKKDPEALYQRGAYGTIKSAVEEGIRKVDPALADQFVADKAQSAIGQAFEPIASRAANVDFAAGQEGLPRHGFSLKSVGFHAAYNPITRHARPYLIPLNEAISTAEPLRQSIPDWLRQLPITALQDDQIRAALIAALRKKEGD